jgi:hypothetical protein
VVSGNCRVRATPTPSGEFCNVAATCRTRVDVAAAIHGASYPAPPANPKTGLASIVYSDDQYRSDAPSSFCTPDDTNTANCDHTAIATQVSGKGIGITAP